MTAEVSTPVFLLDAFGYLDPALPLLAAPELKEAIHVMRYSDLGGERIVMVQGLVAFRIALDYLGTKQRIALDLTGGNKTMSNQLAVASGLLRHHAGMPISLCYIDYDAYLPQFRKPDPQTMHLNFFDDPLKAPLQMLKAMGFSVADPFG